MTDEWYVRQRGKSLGPFSPAQLRRLATVGQLKPEMAVRKGEQGRWVAARKVKGLFAADTSRATPADAGASPDRTPSAGASERVANGGLDLTRQLKIHHSSEDEVDAYVKELKRLLPVVRSAYKPSGRFPINAFPKMALGSCLACLTSVTFGLAMFVAVAIFNAIVQLLFEVGVALIVERHEAFISESREFERRIGGVFAILAGYVTAGGCAGATVAIYGERGRNRSSLANFLFSIPPALFAVVALPLLVRGLFGRPSDWKWATIEGGLTAMQGLAARTDGIGYLLSFAAFGVCLASAVAAGTMAVKRFKYCEPCNQPMTAHGIAKVTLGGAAGAREGL